MSLNSKATHAISSEQGRFYLSKLREIERVLTKDQKENSKLEKIQNIMKEIHEEIEVEEELPHDTEEQNR